MHREIIQEVQNSKTQIKDLPKIIGIYKFTNKITNMVYIGQSVNIFKRYYEHTKNPITLIDKAILTFGINNFDFEILMEFKENDKLLMSESEYFYMDKFNSIVPNGYNVYCKEFDGNIHKYLKLRQDMIINENLISSKHELTIENDTIKIDIKDFVDKYKDIDFTSLELINLINKKFNMLIQTKNTHSGIYKCKRILKTYNVVLTSSFKYKPNNVKVNSYKIEGQTSQ